MSLHVEWIDCGHPFLSVELVEPGTSVGEHETTKHALVINYDEAVVIEGRPEQLRALLTKASTLVDAVEKEG